METHLATTAPSFTINMGIALVIFIIAYGLIFSEVIHRVNAAIIGAIAMIGAGLLMGFYTQEAALKSIDGNTIFLLTAMMMLIGLLKPTGAFDYLAIRMSKLSRGSPVRLFIYLTLSVSIISMFLDNVTTVLIFAPLTVVITRTARVNPLPYLLGEAMTSNIGGIATLIGDPPNIMIGSAANISFNTFIIHMLPIVVVVWLTTTAMLLWMFREHFTAKNYFSELDLDESHAIKDAQKLRFVLIALGITLVLFFLHHLLHLYPAYVALLGVALTLILVRPDPHELLAEVEWNVLIFFAGLFVIVGGIESSGVLHLVGYYFAEIARQPGMLLTTAIILMWMSGILSAIVDNIPITVTLIPIVLSLQQQGVDTTPLWWALSLGVGLGGNGTHIGATANVVCVAESERCGIPEARITPLLWLRKGLPTMLFSLTMGSIFFALFFDYFS